MKHTRTYYDLKQSTKRITSNRGGTRCVSGDTFVMTDTGPKQITKIKPGDTCLSHNERTGSDEYRTITAVHEMQNTKRTIRVKLKSGAYITATEDHKFYFRGDWKCIKHIVSLLQPTTNKEYDNDNMEKDSRI